METEKTVTLYLAGWQKRMLVDFMPRASLGDLAYKDINAVTLKPRPFKCPTSYKIPPVGIHKGDWVLYLTDEQMSIVAKYMGAKVKVSSINISPDFVKSGEITFIR